MTKAGDHSNDCAVIAAPALVLTGVLAFAGAQAATAAPSAPAQPTASGPSFLCRTIGMCGKVANVRRVSGGKYGIRIKCADGKWRTLHRGHRSTEMCKDVVTYNVGPAPHHTSQAESVHHIVIWTRLSVGKHHVSDSLGTVYLRRR